MRTVRLDATLLGTVEVLKINWLRRTVTIRAEGNIVKLKPGDSMNLELRGTYNQDKN